MGLDARLLRHTTSADPPWECRMPQNRPPPSKTPSRRGGWGPERNPPPPPPCQGFALLSIPAGRAAGGAHPSGPPCRPLPSCPPLLKQVPPLCPAAPLLCPVTPPPPSDALEGKGPQRRAQKRVGRRLEEVAKAVGGGYCRLQMSLSLALGVRGTVAGPRLGALPLHPCPSPLSLPRCSHTLHSSHPQAPEPSPQLRHIVHQTRVRMLE